MKNELLTSIIEELNDLKLYHMANELEDVYKGNEFNDMDRLHLIERLTLAEYNFKIDQRLQGRLKRAHLAGSSQCIDKCVTNEARTYLPDGLVPRLASLEFVKEGLNLCILGPSDSGKSYLAKALAAQACAFYSVSYNHSEMLLEEMVALKKKDFEKYQKKMKHFTNLDLLVMDDFLLHTVTEESEIKVLFELMEKRSELQKSTIVCSQREPQSWTAMILNDNVSADSIMKRATKHFTVVISMPKEA